MNFKRCRRPNLKSSALSPLMEVSVLPKPRKAQVIRYTRMLDPTVAPYRTEVRVVLVPLSSECQTFQLKKWIEII